MVKNYGQIPIIKNFPLNKYSSSLNKFSTTFTQMWNQFSIRLICISLHLVNMDIHSHNIFSRKNYCNVITSRTCEYVKWRENVDNIVESLVECTRK